MKPPQQSPSLQPAIQTIIFTVDQLSGLRRHLGRLPFDDVAPVMQFLDQIVTPQLQTAKPASE